MMMLISATALVTIVHLLKWVDDNQHVSGASMLWNSYAAPLLQAIAVLTREALVCISCVHLYMA